MMQQDYNVICEVNLTVETKRFTFKTMQESHYFKISSVNSRNIWLISALLNKNKQVMGENSNVESTMLNSLTAVQLDVFCPTEHLIIKSSK